MRAHRFLLTGSHCLLAVVWLHFAIEGLDYYRAEAHERPRHELYWTFKPGGTVGRNLGFAGALMMSLMLLYSVRKRWPPLRKLGAIRIWLDYHILFGIWGPLFVVLHTSFKVGGLVSLSFWSMITVAVSGVVGRFLYRQIPRTGPGEELSPAELAKLDRRLAKKLEGFGLSSSSVAGLDRLVSEGFPTDQGLLRVVGRAAFDHLRFRQRLADFSRRHLRESGMADTEQSRDLCRAIERKAQLRRRIVLWDHVRRLFHGWHVFHKPFALIMYLFMMVHIAVAWMTGYV